MLVDISIKESEKQIQDKISTSIRDHLNLKFPNIIKDIERVVKKKIFDAITSSKVWFAIQGGDLKFELGLIDGADRLIDIIDIWLRGIETKFKKFKVVGDNLIGGITIEAIRSDYSDILDTNSAIFITENGDKLDWLKWLLLDSSAVIIADYGIRFGAGLGRTGGAVMKRGGSWGISSEFAGVANNNFITKAIDSIQDSLQKDIQQIIEREI